MRVAYLIVSAALLAPPMVNANPADSEVIAAVLDHFAAQPDAVFGRKAGLIFVAPETEGWSKNQVLTYGGNRCESAPDFYDAFAARNSSSTSTRSLVVDSAKWRLPRPGEETNDGRFVVLKTADGQPVKTIAWISLPAFSVNDESAFVMFWYWWSVHRAIAHYVLEKTDLKWRVKCWDNRVFF
jgi:hypothetical protein